MSKVKIVPIPAKMEKYYGKGIMLHPSHQQIEELIGKIPMGMVTTIGIIASFLADKHGTNVTCPMRTGNAIKKIADSHDITEVSPLLPFWRVVRSDCLFIKTKQFEFWASYLADEGFDLEFTKSGNIKVKNAKEHIYTFE